MITFYHAFIVICAISFIMLQHNNKTYNYADLSDVSIIFYFLSCENMFQTRNDNVHFQNPLVSGHM